MLLIRRHIPRTILRIRYTHAGINMTSISILGGGGHILKNTKNMNDFNIIMRVAQLANFRKISLH